MFDDIRIYVPVRHEPIGKRALMPDGSEGPYSRVSLRHPSGPGVRVRSVRNGSGLVIEGSFISMIQGHNVFGTMDLRWLVHKVVRRALTHFDIKPSKEGMSNIENGRIKLERLDVVGFVNVDKLGDSGALLHALDIGLAGSSRNRMSFHRETIVWHSHSRHWSLMAYDKAAQMQKVHPEIWNNLDPAIRRDAQRYLRFELRQFRPQLLAKGWERVCDVDTAAVQAVFAKRLAAMLADLRRPFPSLPVDVEKPSRALLMGLLAAQGVDVISGLAERSQRRVWQELREHHGVTERDATSVPKRYVKTLKAITKAPALPARHGAPRRLRELGLVAVP